MPVTSADSIRNRCQNSKQLLLGQYLSNWGISFHFPERTGHSPSKAPLALHIGFQIFRALPVCLPECFILLRQNIVPTKATGRIVNSSAHINHVGCWYFQKHTLFPKDKAAKEKTPEPDKSKGRRGRKPKEEKAGPGEPGGTGARRGRPAKTDKAAPDRPPSQPRDKMSQSKGGKAATVKGKEEAPAAPAPEQPPQPRDATRAEKEEIVYRTMKFSVLYNR